MPPLVIDIRGADDSRDVVHRAVQALHEGKLVVFPTETVYALAASALNPGAIEQLLKIKNRQVGQPPLTLAVKSADDALDYLPRMTPLAQRLARRCWPGPITLVCEDNHPESLVQRLPKAIRAAVVPQGALGVRVPAHTAILDTLKMLPGPIAITSANRSGEPSALTAQDAVKAFGDGIHLVLDDGRARFGQSSSVVRVDSRLQVLRAGVVSEQTLKRLSAMMILLVCTGNTCRSPMAEGLCRKLVAGRLNCTVDELQDRGVLIMSAGVSASPGAAAANEAIVTLKDCGIDLSSHESQPVTEQLLRHADVIWTMTRSHRQVLLDGWPEVAARTAVLNYDNLDIADPIGGPLELYRRCAAQIEAELKKRLEDLDWSTLV